MILVSLLGLMDSTAVESYISYKLKDVSVIVTMCNYNICAFLILCSNDVESNPGPLVPLVRGPNLEKAVTDLRWLSFSQTEKDKTYGKFEVWIWVDVNTYKRTTCLRV